MLKYFFILIASNCIAQSHYELELKVTSTSGAFDYKIAIHKNQISTIYFSNLSSKSQTYERKDSIRKKDLLNKKFRTAKENQEIDLLTKKYKIYNKDSLIVLNEELLIKLSDSLFKSYNLILKEKNSNDYPIRTHETIVNISINRDKNFNVYGPDKLKYTIVYCLLKEAMLVYNKSTDKPIFPKTYFTFYANY